jgi:hypothetical protein
MVPLDFFSHVYAVDLSEVTFPQDLLPLVEKLKGVMRFVNKVYPPGVIVDDGFTHTARLVAAIDLALEAAYRDYGRRMGTLHDLHESSGTKDYTLIELIDNPPLRKSKREEELVFAATLTRESDRHIINDYNRAGDFLRGGVGDLREITYTAMIVKLLDILEGDITLHRSLSTWAASDAYVSSSMPQAKSLMHGLCLCRNLQDLFRELDHTSSELGLQLLLAAESYIGHRWRRVDLDRVPDVIRSFFNL